MKKVIIIKRALRSDNCKFTYLMRETENTFCGNGNLGLLYSGELLDMDENVVFNQGMMDDIIPAEYDDDGEYITDGYAIKVTITAEKVDASEMFKPVVKQDKN